MPIFDDLETIYPNQIYTLLLRDEPNRTHRLLDGARHDRVSIGCINIYDIYCKAEII